LYEFVETATFSKQLLDTEDDDLLEVIQREIAANPMCGELLRSGMRKMRVRSPKRGEGKRGGYRVIYFFADPHDLIFLIWLLDKKEAENLNPRQEAEAVKIVKTIQEEL